MDSVRERYARLLHAYCMDMHQYRNEGSNIGHAKYTELVKKSDALESSSEPASASATAEEYAVMRCDYVNAMRGWCAMDRSHNYAHRRLKEIPVEFPPTVEAK